MPQSLAKILVHTVFSTKDRRPFLRDKILREELHRYLGGILTNLDCQRVIVGGVEDHVHLLCALSRTREAATMVKEVKRGSSLWLKTKSPELTDFAWQNGYGIFSIGFSQIKAGQDYIAGQEEHHRTISFQDEFRQLLVRYEIGFNERYVWDWCNPFRLMIFGGFDPGQPLRANLGLNDCHPFGIASGGEDGQILLKAMRTLTNTICTPHVASRTYESVVRQATCAVKNLILAMNGEKPSAQVNPEVPAKKAV